MYQAARCPRLGLDAGLLESESCPMEHISLLISGAALVAACLALTHARRVSRRVDALLDRMPQVQILAKGCELSKEAQAEEAFACQLPPQGTIYQRAASGYRASRTGGDPPMPE